MTKKLKRAAKQVGAKKKARVLPKRGEVKLADQWDLTQLFVDDAAWESAFGKWEGMIKEYEGFKGRLGESAKVLAEALAFDSGFERMGERLGSYAGLKASGDQGDSTYQRMVGRYQHVAVKAGEAASYMRPEILAIAPEVMEGFLNGKGAAELAEWKLALERIVRYRPHTLGKGEEQLLAMSGQVADGPGAIFRQLTDTDLKWPTIADEHGVKVELGHSSFSKFLQSPKRKVREEAFRVYYSEYEKHKHTLAASYNAAVQRDVFYSKARKYKSSREGSLFADNVPVGVYDALIEAVHRHLPVNHRYLALRAKALKIKDVHMYDTYVPMVSGIQMKHTWEEAATVVTEALSPLGESYTKALHEGLTVGRWSDRYPNAGKRSGAFSAGGFDGPPYILMNYQPEVLDHVFTLAHEAGHSMHTWHSARHQPYQYYGYTIFVAEVASTFNEQLLLKYMLERAKNDKERAYLLNHAIDEIRGTIIRQTMFAEFEKIAHDYVEKGEPLTVELVRKEYRGLLEKYFGVEAGAKLGAVGKKSKFVIDEVLDLECLRIPHFYGGFYVYKYATGLSAAIALSQRVLNGGKRELEDYLRFLKGGCSKWPLDLLRDAGVDLESPAPVEAALKRFGELVGELEAVL